MILSYQAITGLFQVALGALMVSFSGSFLASALSFPAASSPFVSVAGMFIFCLGLCALSGAYMELRQDCSQRLQIVWLLTALMHIGPAILIATEVGIGSMANGWLWIAALCGVCASIELLFIKLSSSPRFKPACSLIDSRKIMKPAAEWKRWIH
jgi:hypothetical protein